MPLFVLFSYFSDSLLNSKLEEAVCGESLCSVIVKVDQGLC